ncbi:hypothetical protein ARMGADRAFT_288642 [Armillaria gallica]|uniref:Uncharacterized protein n=1 Tax=Armillaria gallica TaxID=47427 RepID=A0A2H3C7J9_ARMGA|nr:hypothetical protein ARMGADRAFT_288642 [Armillaria gallica]
MKTLSPAVKQAEEATNVTEEKVTRGSADEEEPEEEKAAVTRAANALKKEAAQAKRKATMAANASARTGGTKHKSGDVNDRTEGPRRSKRGKI